MVLCCIVIKKYFQNHGLKKNPGAGLEIANVTVMVKKLIVHPGVGIFILKGTHQLCFQMSSYSSEHHSQKSAYFYLFDVTKMMRLYFPCTYSIIEKRISGCFLIKWET